MTFDVEEVDGISARGGGTLALFVAAGFHWDLFFWQG
jgi:hypothetical protein